MLFRIGDFSRLGQVSVKTLHHYDEVGLLRPARVDRENGYRYYSAGQLQRLGRILSLKMLGLSLEEIAEVLDAGLSGEPLRDMLRWRRVETLRRIREEQERLAQVEHLIKRLDEEECMPEFDVIVKTIAPQLVASIRRVVPDIDALAPCFPEIEAYLRSAGGTISGPGMLIYYDTEHCEGELDAEAAFPLTGRVPDPERIRVYEIPETDYATLVYTGDYEHVREAHMALGQWIADHGYRLAGPHRVVFLQCEDNEDGSAVVEIQYAVTREG